MSAVLSEWLDEKIGESIPAHLHDCPARGSTRDVTCGRKGWVCREDCGAGAGELQCPDCAIVQDVKEDLR